MQFFTCKACNHTRTYPHNRQKMSAKNASIKFYFQDFPGIISMTEFCFWNTLSNHMITDFTWYPSVIFYIAWWSQTGCSQLLTRYLWTLLDVREALFCRHLAQKCYPHFGKGFVLDPLYFGCESNALPIHYWEHIMLCFQVDLAVSATLSFWDISYLKWIDN